MCDRGSWTRDPALYCTAFGSTEFTCTAISVLLCTLVHCTALRLALCCSSAFCNYSCMAPPSMFFGLVQEKLMAQEEATAAAVREGREQVESARAQREQVGLQSTKHVSLLSTRHLRTPTSMLSVHSLGFLRYRSSTLVQCSTVQCSAVQAKVYVHACPPCIMVPRRGSIWCGTSNIHATPTFCPQCSP
jgi:hypothetical protein